MQRFTEGFWRTLTRLTHVYFLRRLKFKTSANLQKTLPLFSVDTPPLSLSRSLARAVGLTALPVFIYSRFHSRCDEERLRRLCYYRGRSLLSHEQHRWLPGRPWTLWCYVADYSWYCPAWPTLQPFHNSDSLLGACPRIRTCKYNHGI